jgi:hypothetical protein
MLALTAALTNTFPVVKTPAAPVEKVNSPKPAAVAIDTTGSPETTSTQATTAGIDYTMVAKAITDVFKVDRAKVIAALAKFGAAKGPQLKAEDYEAFLAELA